MCVCVCVCVCVYVCMVYICVYGYIKVWVSGKMQSRFQQEMSSLPCTELPVLKACVCYFLANFHFLPNDNPSKTMKDVFYFI